MVIRNLWSCVCWPEKVIRRLDLTSSKGGFSPMGKLSSLLSGWSSRSTKGWPQFRKPGQAGAPPPALPPVLPPVSAEALAAGEDGGSSSDHQKGDAS